MLKQKGKYIILSLLLAIMFSCTKAVDFNQADDLKIEPVVESSIVFFKGTASNFFAGGSEVSVIQDAISISVFDDDFIQDNLVKSEFVFESTNSFNRGFSMQIDFLNEINEVHHTLTFTAPASPSNQDVVTTHTEVFEGDSLTDLKNTKSLVITLTMLSGTPITLNTVGEINLQSKGVFYLNIES
ncbi:hypothetical protein A8C32_09030 [Flavivirga aquatica]|uniref:Uncharacterized protein n=1 Tax=Flavivirga aquatica TaxID=1849968 RepID=A0A1E5SJJ2_9FLAO|nr:hypothetical protein [Flavivirga aquatica]OEJ99299.1 hypothetical protein A8C32_09030 [Flavivirga aquatica]